MTFRSISLAAVLFLSLPSFTKADDLRIGMIGLDTSHTVEFTKRLNDPSEKNHIPGAKIVAAFKGGSPDLPDESMKRIPPYAKTLEEKFGVKMYGTIEELVKNVDAVMIESVDGRPHLEQARPVIMAHKTLFIDKPMGGSLRDVIKIYQLAKEYNVPVFSGSSLRYYPNLQAMIKTNYGELKGADSVGPSPLESHHPDLFWYGIHPTEVLFTIMGTGCETVACTATPDTHLVTGVWAGGKVGTLRGIRNAAEPYRATIFGSKKVVDEQLKGDYTPFLGKVIEFLKTGVAPVPAAETLEIYAFMEAADESKRQGGKPVKIADVMQTASQP